MFCCKLSWCFETVSCKRLSEIFLSFVSACAVCDAADVKIGKCVSVGGGSCIMPGACVEDGAFIGDVSLVMKGEVVPAGCCWSGVPAIPHDEHAPTMF